MRRYLIVALLVLLLPTLSWSLATTMELGVRGGMDAGKVHENYSFGEVYYLKTLPWQKVISPDTLIYTRLDAGAGYLGADSRGGGWLAIGGDVVFSMMNGAWEFDVGTRPALLSKHEYGKDDFGGSFQFFSHAGVTLNLDRITLGYRYEHISNAMIYKSNPGLNLHVIGLGMRF